MIGLLPADVRRFTVYSAAVSAGAKAPEQARALIRCLAAPAAAVATRILMKRKTLSQHKKVLALGTVICYCPLHLQVRYVMFKPARLIK